MSTPTPPPGYGWQDPKQYGQQPYGQYDNGQPYSSPGGSILGNLAAWPSRAGGTLIDGLVVAVPYGIGTVFLSRQTAPMAIVAMLLYIVSLGVGIWNVVVRQGGSGQTVGKSVLGLKLVGADTGRPIGAGKAFVRQLSHILDGMACCIGYLWPLWDEKRQTFADKANNTYVIKL
ncbi:RDD family protein [Kribbella sp. VKM Ac-2566]|uniref:RDD family protein n=1 Tax=Kribbella sp. VKM Ac-2566 TaxID=2512218 RepID=UPI0010E3DDD4|nr:RDD family protein [Kribbella sp. VKM Ac-2566]TDX08290.1 putative RDD family membrane protein YckC [Kribbella sp. VKM Ac-2566]